MVLTDREIKKLALGGMISPFVPEKTRNLNGRLVPSYGLSHCGYDFRLADEFRFRRPYKADILNPTTIEPSFSDAIPGPVTLNPLDAVLSRSLEYFRIPKDIFAVVYGKSTWARLFVHILVTPLEPEWEGYITVEVVNLSPAPVVLYPGVGIAQVVFYRLQEAPDTTYNGAGVYQNQEGIVLPKIA